MADEVIRVVLEGDAAVNAALNSLGSAFDRVNSQARAMGASLDQSTARLSQSIGAQGQVMGQTLSAQGKLADGTRMTISAQEQFGTTVDSNTKRMGYFQRELRNIGTAIIIWQGLREVVQTINDVHDAQAALSAEVVRFGLVTGQYVGEAKEAYLSLQSVTTGQGILPSEAGTTIGTAARFAPGDTEGQKEFIRTVSQASNVFGIEPARMTSIFTASLKQQNLEAKDASIVFDQLVASYKGGVGDIAQLGNAMTEASTIQGKWNTEYVETLGLITELSGATGEGAETVTSALVRMTDVISKLDGSQAVEFAQAWREIAREANVPINIQTDTGEFLDPLDMLMEIGSAWDQLNAEQQNKAFELLGLLKPTYQQIGRATLSALADGQLSNLEVIKDAGEAAGKAFLDSYAGQLQKARALQEEVFQTQGAAAGLVSRLSTWAFEFVGDPESAAKVNEQLRGAPAGLGQAEKDAFIKSLVGMSEEEARQAIQDWNERVATSARRNFETLGSALNPFTAANIGQVADALTFSSLDEGISRWRELSDAAKEAAGAIKPVADMAAGDVLNLTGGVFKNQYPDTTPDAQTGGLPDDGLTETQRRRRDILLNQGTGALLPTNSLDAQSLSQQEFNQALTESQAVYDAILQQQIEEMRLAGMTQEQIDEQVAKLREAAEITSVLVELEGQRYDYVSGTQAVYLKDAVQNRLDAKRETERTSRESESNFAFRRLKDVDPSQFGQLQASAQMYNQMLTAMGSPEKNKNINLMLGEENVFKSMNVRMTALQLALEDLTKVEKAQLSGTWNLPAGATALVPISSLDVQGWNQPPAGGGGLANMTPEQFAAILGEMNQSATGTGGGIVGNTVQERRRITGYDEAQMRREVGDLMDSARQRPSRLRPSTDEAQMRQEVGNLMDSARRRQVDREPRSGSMPRTLAPRVDVNVNPAPIKNTINLNVIAQVNAGVLFKIVQTMLFSQLARMSRSGPGNTSNRGISSVR